MSTSTALRPSVRAALSALIDYAGLFPPAELPVRQASDEYRKERSGPYAWMLGRFIIPDRTLRVLPPDLTGPFSVIVQHDLDALHAVAGRRRQGAHIEALEIALPQGGALADAVSVVSSDISVTGDLDDLPSYLELPRGPWWSELLLRTTMKALRASGFGAKLRCGGLTADAFPGVREVASFIAGARSENVPFKATAGLHHPVRHLDPVTGFMQHGFLNLLAAAALARRVTGGTLEQIVAEEDASAFAFDDDAFSWRAERIGVAELERARREGFVAYGSCSFSEPVDDLIALGMLPAR
jgi:hypothetical protein